jgi:hypothetical protein
MPNMLKCEMFSSDKINGISYVFLIPLFHLLEMSLVCVLWLDKAVFLVLSK